MDLAEVLCLLGLGEQQNPFCEMENLAFCALPAELGLSSSASTVSKCYKILGPTGENRDFQV